MQIQQAMTKQQTLQTAMYPMQTQRTQQDVYKRQVEKDPDAEIVAGIDIADQGKNSYPVFTDIDACQVEADAIIEMCIRDRSWY